MIGEKLGSFRIESTLGVGAMGVVYKATNETTGRPAAVKVVNSEIAQRGKAYERFRREAEILQQFRHSNIVRFLAVGRYQGTSYFAMEYIKGQTLEQMLNEKGAMEWREVAELAIQLADALHYAHEHGVVHRDLKPSNLMVTEAGRVKLTDFGIAKDLDKTALTATGRTLGTAAYMAPEQIRGTPDLSHKTDLYALGIVLYQCLTGVPPFDGSSVAVLMHAHLNSPIPRASSKVAEIPRALDDLVLQLMAKAPQDRPWDAAAVSVKLSEILEKVKRGESVPMVWATTESNNTVPATQDSAKSTPSTKKGKKSKKSTGKSTRWGSEDSDSTRLRARLEPASLVFALLVLSTFIGYMLWPPGMEYLYENAKSLMATKERHNWVEARARYLDPLDQRFPNHPFKETTNAWRDQILLAEAEGRARVLESPVNTRFNEPVTPNEQKFVVIHNTVLAAEKEGNDLKAGQAWEEMARQLDPDQPEDRPWYLLAKKRAGAVAKGIENRHQLVLKLLDEVSKAFTEGDSVRASNLREEILKQYGKFADLAELLGLPATNVPPPPSTSGSAEPTSRPDPTAPSTVPNKGP